MASLSKIEIDLNARTLTLLKRRFLGNDFKVKKRYPIAIGFYDGPGGEPDYRTPPGSYTITAKAKNPDWLMPSSPWVAPELQGTLIKGGDPRNPIVARWLRLEHERHGYTGVGIHGTASRSSIGSAASHGCIRMLEEDVIDLYGRVRKGTPVEIRQAPAIPEGEGTMESQPELKGTGWHGLPIEPTVPQHPRR